MALTHPRHHLLRSLTTRLMLFTTIIVVTASVSLSAVFIHQEVERATGALQIGRAHV